MELDRSMDKRTIIRMDKKCLVHIDIGHTLSTLSLKDKDEELDMVFYTKDLIYLKDKLKLKIKNYVQKMKMKDKYYGI
ncbi:MAG: hypothetical protein ABIJ08_05905 [Nanoarchaeota archaeon]